MEATAQASESAFPAAQRDRTIHDKAYVQAHLEKSTFNRSPLLRKAIKQSMTKPTWKRESPHPAAQHDRTISTKLKRKPIRERSFRVTLYAEPSQLQRRIFPKRARTTTNTATQASESTYPQQWAIKPSTTDLTPIRIGTKSFIIGAMLVIYKERLRSTDNRAATVVDVEPQLYSRSEVKSPNKTDANGVARQEL